MSKLTISYYKFLDIITKLYQYRDGYVQYQPGQTELAHKEQVALTYGEILPSSLKTIINALNLSENDVFYDLGGGVGKVALQMFLTTTIKKCCSIEYFPPRYEIANNIYQLIKNKDLGINLSNRLLENVQANFLNLDLSDATIIFMDSLCFTKDTIQALNNQLNQLKNLRYVIGLKEMNLNKLKLNQQLNLEFSWSKGQPSTLVYIYAKP